MKRRFVQTRRWSMAIATVVFATACAAPARADVAYAFAQQTIDDLSIMPATGGFSSATPVVTITNDGTTLNGSGGSNSDPLDAPQSYLGTPPPAPQNDFGMYATFSGAPPQTAGSLPTGPGNFTRGDALILNPSSGTNTGSTVSESYLTGTAASSETANGGFTASFSFTPTATTTLSIFYNYVNDAYVATSGMGNASATYKFDITIKNSAGAVVFDSATTQTNLNLVAPPQGGEISQTGNQTVTTTSLTGGDEYTMIFSANTNTAVTLSPAAVPEPGPMALAAVTGIVMTVAGVLRRRRPKA
jgi:hypothetical protein